MRPIVLEFAGGYWDGKSLRNDATEPSLDAPVDPQFGRCPYFLIGETDDLACEAVENPNLETVFADASYWGMAITRKKQ